jgi:hypothetical protein
VRIVFRDGRQGKSTQLWKLNDGFVEQSFTPGGSANNRSEKGMNSSIEAGVKIDDVRGHDVMEEGHAESTGHVVTTL